MLSRFSLGTLLLLAPATAFAQAGPLPSARQVLDRYIAAAGGKEALLAHTSTRTIGTMEIPAQGLRADIEVLMARPNRLTTKASIPGLGDIRSGFDGRVGWSIDPMQGPRLLTGAELDMIREQGDQGKDLYPADQYASMENAGAAEMGGVPCYRVKLVSKSGREVVDCFAIETGLLAGREAKQETQMGTVDVKFTFSDYREVGGVKRPMKSTQDIMGMKQVMTIASVEYDTVPATAFELPPEIRTLVEKQGAPKSPDERR